MTRDSAPASVPDLGACATEPIHVPGAIQPHGALLLVQPATARVLQASENAAALLGRPGERMAGQGLADWLDAADADRLLTAVGASRRHEGSVRAGAGGVPFFVTAHALDGLALLELEPGDGGPGLAGDLDAALRSIAEAADIGSVTAACARHVRAFSGFDRVMVYRFDDDDHGEVVAEARAPALPPFLGHHYPESDIPRQARALYLRSWIRCIPDARYRPVPLVPTLRPDTQGPLDLTDAHLRSVSPVHLEYLANMGVAASMSVSLVVDGRLWGLISCHHGQPRAMPARLRRACGTLGRMVSLQIGALAATEFRRREQAAAPGLQLLRRAMEQQPDRLFHALADQPQALLDLVAAGGAAAMDAQGITRVGDCPQESAVRELADLVRGRASEGMFCTHQLSLEAPAWSALAAQASGLLALVLPPGERMLLWFRPQVPHTVLWAGDPDKSARSEVENGVPRLHPRRSFATWQEEVRGKSLPWLPVERHLACELRRHAVEIDLARQVELQQAAVRARDDLVAVVSHDLRTPVSVVAMQATLIKRFLGDSRSEESRRAMTGAQTIQQAAARMTALLGDLLDLARIEAGRFQVQPLPRQPAGLVHDACELMRDMAGSRQIALEAQVPAGGAVLADSERIFHVFANLIGNAIRYTPAGGRITVGALPGPGRCQFFVQDTGRGMQAGELEHIFDRYWQARPTDGGTGTGLGLYICRGIVEAHGGRIWAESAPGQGSTFRFELPWAGQEAATS